LRSRAHALLALLLVVVGLLSAACGDDASADVGASGKDIEQLAPDLVPSELLGLKASQEDMTPSLEGSTGSYVDGVGLWAYRTPDDLLQATLQISRFTEDSRYREASFRLAVVDRIGGSRPRSIRLGDDTVYLTTGSKQQLAVWFRGPYLLVLSTRDDFDHPRTLLREALEIQP
jgi:hypothetical protein